MGGERNARVRQSAYGISRMLFWRAVVISQIDILARGPAPPSRSLARPSPSFATLSLHARMELNAERRTTRVADAPGNNARQEIIAFDASIPALALSEPDALVSPVSQRQTHTRGEYTDPGVTAVLSLVRDTRAGRYILQQ